MQISILQGLMRAPASPGASHVLFEQFWLERGPLPLPALGVDDDGSARRFVLTPSVRQQLCNLARCVLAHKHPILLQVGWLSCKLVFFCSLFLHMD
jgi:midasin